MKRARGIFGLGDVRHWGESELRMDNMHRQRHPLDGVLLGRSRDELTVKDIPDFRCEFVHILERTAHDALRVAYQQALLGPDRNLVDFQEAIRVGKELLVFLTTEHYGMELSLLHVLNLLIAHWAVTSNNPEVRKMAIDPTIKEIADDYNRFIREMEQNKLSYPSRYSFS